MGSMAAQEEAAHGNMDHCLPDSEASLFDLPNSSKFGLFFHGLIPNLNE
jgi:hypothetical protein